MAKQVASHAGARSTTINSPIFVVAVAALIALTSTDLSQIVFAFAGALAFAFLQMRLPVPPQKASKKLVEEPPAPQGGRSAARGAPAARQAPQARAAAAAKTVSARPPETWHPSIQPVANLSFKSDAFEGAVDELVRRITPSEATDKTVQQLVAAVRQELQQLIPGVEVLGCVAASLDLGSGTAFGVAVPEVDLVVIASPAELAKHIPLGPNNSHDVHKLTKAAIRACADRLVSGGRFKFRRSAFRSDEPRVNLLATTALNIHEEAIPISFSVNAVSPLYCTALMNEAGRSSQAALELILLVRRWAKHRAICHSAKGHLSPYHWTLLAIYFLQVRAEGSERLPPLADWDLPVDLEGSGRRCAEVLASRPHGRASTGAAATLFKAFLKFYAKEFDVHGEAVSVRLGRRGSPPTSLPLHVTVDDQTGASEVGWSIEDPLDRRHNLGDVSTAWSLGRLREELTRAHQICSGPEPSLTTLLEPWVPAGEAA